MSATLIIICALFHWNSTNGNCDHKSPVVDPARQVQIESVDMTLMENYDRYLVEPKFQTLPTRKA